jgi:uncharacterized membrane protein YbhN (UPF0104 family)
VTSEQQSTEPPPQADQRFSLGRRSLAIPTVISFTLAVAFIVFMLTRFDIDLSTTWGHIKGSQPGFLVLAFFLYYLSFPLRGYRWLILLGNVGTFRDGAKKPSLPNASSMILLSCFVNSVAWFRLGDAYRAYLVTGQSRASFARTVGTVAAERVMDVGVVFALLLVASIGLLRDETSDTAKSVILGASALAALGAIILLAMRIFGMRLARFLPPSLRHVYGRFQEGTLGSFRRLPLLLLLSAAIWLLEAARLYFVVEGLGFELSLSLILFAALAHSLLTTIPLTPGGLGFVEGGLTGLLVLSLTVDQAVGVTLLDRSITYLSIVVIGGLAFARRSRCAALRQESRRLGRNRARLPFS